MKKIICLLLCIALCSCFVSCNKEPEEITLTKENFSDYAFIDINFGEVTITETDASIWNQDEKYYLTCMATVTVKPKGNYTFKNASVSLKLSRQNDWIPMRAHSPNLGSTTPDWSGSVQLDKNGYGEITVFFYHYSNTYEKKHPAIFRWECSRGNISGTLISNDG